jgi:hypothetical protein
MEEDEVQGRKALVVRKEGRPQFYGRTYTLAEIADLVDLPPDDNLQDELAAVRVTIRRTMGRLYEDLEPAEFARLAAMVFTGANTVARLLRTRHAIGGRSNEEMDAIFAEVLPEVGKQWGLKL